MSFTVTHVEQSQSEMPASTKLTAQVRRSDKWLQLDRAVFGATDFSTYGASSDDLNMALQGTTHK